MLLITTQMFTFYIQWIHLEILLFTISSLYFSCSSLVHFSTCLDKFSDSLFQLLIWTLKIYAVLLIYPCLSLTSNFTDITFMVSSLVKLLMLHLSDLNYCLMKKKMETELFEVLLTNTDKMPLYRHLNAIFLQETEPSLM